MRGGTMNFETVVVIYIVKNSLAIDAKIGKWLNKFYHNGPDYEWDRRAIEKVIRNAINDYLMHCDNMGLEVTRYFLYRYENFVHDEFSAMVQFIQNIQVRHNDEYINGFSEELYTEAMDSMRDI